MPSHILLTARESIPAAIVPVQLPSNFSSFSSNGVMHLLDETSGKRTLAQAVPLTPDRWFVAADGLDAGRSKRFRALEEGEPTGTLGVEVSEEEGALGIDVHGERLTHYFYSPENAPARPYFYPLLAPGGLPVTRSFPMADVAGETRDHKHHRSLWVAHGEVNGADNWSEETGHARTEHVALEGWFSGPLAGGFRERTRWVTSEGEPLLDETREVVVYAADPAVRILDLTLRFTPSNRDVIFGDTKEGGLISVRVATSMDAEKNGTIVNGAGGVNEKETWGKPAPWCDYYGPVQGHTLGIALMDHPSNPRHPTHWHVRNYGLMTANPFGLSYFYNDKSRDGSLVMPAGETQVWRYRLLIHPGSTESARIPSQYAAFASDVTATLEE